MAIHGECFCGRVKYRILGNLKHARSCHCSRCRKLTGGQASVYAEVDPTQFEWLQGEEFLITYSGQPGFGHQFCSRCGSILCGVYLGQVHGVMLGSVNGDPDIYIDYHIYVGSKASWEKIPAGVRTYLEGVTHSK
ncbi:GFA family protein [Vibrio sp.]|uniref:GFA family protein n=1 Tax=Vibrio sp. TaxID=678 RepID=UPI003D116670